MGISSHQLQREFPNYKDLIGELKVNDHKFAANLKRYTELDREIEGLEKRDAPIADSQLVEMKQERALLKDELYQCLLKNAGSPR